MKKNQTIHSNNSGISTTTKTTNAKNGNNKCEFRTTTIKTPDTTYVYTSTIIKKK